MLMFKLLPGLKQRAVTCYQQVVSMGNADQDKYDIQLLRQIDQTLET